MFRRPKVPNDKNKKQLIFNFVSLLIPVFIDFPHVLLLRKSLGKLRTFETLKWVMMIVVSVSCQVGNELPKIVMEILKQSLIFLPTFDLISSV